MRCCECDAAREQQASDIKCHAGVYPYIQKSSKELGCCFTKKQVQNYMKGEPQSNADRIRSMNDEELARFLCDFRDNHGEGCSCNNCVAADYCGTGHNGMIEWLRRPTEVDE